MTKLTPTRITAARGDGIGPEIMDAVCQIMDQAGASLEIDWIEIGKKIYESGVMTGIRDEDWDTLKRNGVFLKSPITTPQGGGYKSLNVTIRKTLGLYSNIRPCVSYHPFVQSKHPELDMVIVRENEEDLYAGVEYRQTQDVVQCLKLISRQGCERIVRSAFDYARIHGRKKVTALVKDNIMKMTDGLFHRIFKEIAPEYPEIAHDSLIIDIGTARIADTPEIFDVVVTLNLYGDIVSDVAAQIAGSVGLAGSVNMGSNFAMFEAIHGSAPDISGKGIANPSGLLLGAVMMLVHIGQGKVAERIHNAWLKTLEDGIHTGDIYRASQSKQRANTQEFSQAICERLGERPTTLQPVSYDSQKTAPPIVLRPYQPAKKELVGVDIYIEFPVDAETVANKLQNLSKAQNTVLQLKMMSNRGQMVWPVLQPTVFCVDLWRCRFGKADGSPVTQADIIALYHALTADGSNGGVDIVKSENLYRFDGEPAFSGGFV